jgi:hypothetical protein
MKSLLPVLLLIIISAIVVVVTAQTPTYAPLNYKFVADIEVAYDSAPNSPVKKTTNARIFGDPTTSGYPCVIVTQNRTRIAMPQISDLARVEICGQPAVNMQFAQLDPEFQLLARICNVIKWPDAGFNSPTDTVTPLVAKQLAGVPVYSGTARCYPKPLQETCYCTCSWAFDDANWVGEARQALRAQEISQCTGQCFPEAFVTVMSMMAVKMTPEMIVGSCDTLSTSSLNGNSANNYNHQNTDGTTFSYEYAVPTNFPQLPNEFAANFKVTLLEYGVSLEFSQAFSAPLRASRTSVFNVMDSIGGEFASGETYLTHGTSQMSFRMVHSTVHASGADNRPSSYSDIDSCDKILFDETIFASSVHRLLMVPSTAPPVFVGRYTVRGIVCDLWTQAVGATTRVDWYFPTNTSMPISPDDARLPRRMVLRGIGRSPFFANHPFVPYTTNLKVDDTDYCDRKPFFYDPHCSGLGIDVNAMQYQHIIDIAELPRTIAMNNSIYLPPAKCTDGAVLQGCSDGVNGVIVFFLSLVCIVVGVYSGRTCCAPKKTINGVDEEMEAAEKNAASRNNAQSSGASRAAASSVLPGRN